MRTTSRWTLLALTALLPLAACGPDEADDEIDPMDDPAAAPAPQGPDTDMMEPMSVSLDEKNESGVMGEATATHHGDSVTVLLNVSGVTEDGEYAAHVHSGDCMDTGEVMAPLNSVQATGGSGMSTTELLASDVPEDQGAVIQVHDQNGEPIACGDLAGHGDMEMDGMEDDGMDEDGMGDDGM